MHILGDSETSYFGIRPTSIVLDLPFLYKLMALGDASEKEINYQFCLMNSSIRREHLKDFILKTISLNH